jgi:hypothetical protein
MVRYRYYCVHIMFDREKASACLEAALTEHEDVFVPLNREPEAYFDELAADIRACVCEPFLLSAKVEEPAFPWADVGEQISGYCVARRDGYWLVYQTTERRFLCFWGAGENLGAHGVYGSPLYCWSA